MNINRHGMRPIPNVCHHPYPTWFSLRIILSAFCEFWSQMRMRQFEKRKLLSLMQIKLNYFSISGSALQRHCTVCRSWERGRTVSFLGIRKSDVLCSVDPEIGKIFSSYYTSSTIQYMQKGPHSFYETTQMVKIKPIWCSINQPSCVWIKVVINGGGKGVGG